MKIGAVIIGRNEGARLVACLNSMQGMADRIIYVDSGSSDNSIAAARAVGAEVVELDPAHPFTAARARSAGFTALKSGDLPEFVQFVDGDCTLQDGWLTAAEQELTRDNTLGIVTGWRAEIHRNASIYNALCDFEWHRPAGDILTCGGDMMVRSTAFDQVGGFDPTVIAAEDDEFCVRIRKAGWNIRRLPLPMTRHDAAMTRFSQWWSRAVRSGHGFAQVGFLHPEYFTRERKRVLFYGGALPLIALAGALFSLWIPLTVLAIYVLNYIRTTQGLHREGLPKDEAFRHAVLITLSKIPNFQGMLTFWWRRLRGHKMNIIEYK